jgi:hypothetical protein
MASTIDFSSLNDNELLYGYQRVNRARFPDNFIACTEEIARRGLEAPEKFEIQAIGTGFAFSAFQKIGEGFSTLAQSFVKKSVSPQA